MRCACLADIHGNLEALNAVLQDAGEQKIDTFLCLGDIVGYGPDPHACITLVQKHAMQCIHGNHELGVLDIIDVADFSYLARESTFWTRRQLDLASTCFIESLPATLQCEDILAVHGSISGPEQYLCNDTERTQAMEDFTAKFPKKQYFLYGHTHCRHLYGSDGSTVVPEHNEVIALKHNMRYLLNPGSVGQPRDLDPRSCYAVLDTKTQTWTQRMLEYPIDAVYNKILKNKLPVELAIRLKKGK